MKSNIEYIKKFLKTTLEMFEEEQDTEDKYIIEKIESLIDYAEKIEKL